LSVNQVQLARSLFVAGQADKALLLFQSAWKAFGSLMKPLFYDFLCDEAEALLDRGETRLAIQAWQDIATIMQADTPEHVYQRMSHCYALNTQGFGGTSEENHVFGDFHKHDLLEFFHAQLQPYFYFEIGVDQGLSLARARGKALGVDARPKLNLVVELPDTAKVLGMSSDAFFRDCAAQELAITPDFAFIDGMHLFEFALRDFMNLEKYAAPYTLVGIDDIFPCHPIQAERRRQSGAWTGDVWKIMPVLEKYRPDLTLLTLRCSTTGLLLISGLDPKNRVLEKHYDVILAEYQSDLALPDKYLQRSESIASDHPVVEELLCVLRHAKNQEFNFKQTQKWLGKLSELIVLAKADTSKNAVDLPKLKSTEFEQTELTLYWREAENDFAEINTLKKRYSLNGSLNVFSLKLPEFEHGLEGLRLDISDCEGSFFVHSLTIQNAAGDVLWDWGFDMSKIGQTNGLEFAVMPNLHQAVMVSTGDDPHFILNVPDVVLAEVSGGGVSISFAGNIINNP